MFSACVKYAVFVYFFFECDGEHRDLPVLTHSFPTRRSSDLGRARSGGIMRGRKKPGTPAMATQAALHSSTSSRRRSPRHRSEEHTPELQSLMRISYAVFCLKKKTNTKTQHRAQRTHRTHSYHDCES